MDVVAIHRCPTRDQPICDAVAIHRMPPTGGVGRMIASIYAVLGLSPACSLAPSPGDSTVPGAWKQEVSIDECVSSLRKRIRQLHPCNADGIVSYMISRKPPEEIRQYPNASDDQIQRLNIEATSSSLPSMQQFPLSASEGMYTPFIHWQREFYPSGSYHGIQPPLHPINQVGSSHGIQAQNPSTGLVGAFQSPFPRFIGMGERFQSYNIPGDGLPTNYGDVSQSVTGYPLSSSKEQIEPCFFFSMGSCKKESQQCDSSLTCLLTMLCTTRVIERHGQCYIVPVEEAPKYLDDDYNLVMTAGGSGANQIYITFGPKSTFTKEDVWNYFSQYGPVNDVQIPLRKKRVFGYVSFLYNGTVKEILSKTMKPHFICGTLADISYFCHFVDLAVTSEPCKLFCSDDDLGLPINLDDIF
ncbi:hypothetical protein HU200_054810 [Digitaria exilis]|uniref:RRM domain-containing protein n=1 Tax=Digitaria exilis TaxID=1010633 RepID=A0A835AK86_9POAL|nr:hypothetical protein HU200_054810 [Digitaria exilis]